MSRWEPHRLELSVDDGNLSIRCVEHPGDTSCALNAFAEDEGVLDILDCLDGQATIGVVAVEHRLDDVEDGSALDDAWSWAFRVAAVGGERP